MANEWIIKGDYVEACNCDVACQCIWLEPPDDDVCTVSLAWHIEDGSYGDVDLSGVDVGMLISTDEGVMFAPETEWDIVLLVDETADDDQREAIEDIYSGRAGGIWAPVADTHVRSVDVATAPISFSRDGSDFTVEVGDAIEMDASGAVGFNEEVGTVSPHPLTESLEVQTGKSTTATVSYDDQFTWDVSGNNAYLGDFELANS
ncbi:hypothetical protein C477_08988 [Haloterrigena salina JCM 13891]|uniref:DUF1326 domain-containing protein n=1 Tax=Haloterrigena salina JCM 13891 TaxID=1227488 RepID=M0CA24_9EURY|nr:DUF1326 domain-containing protein [Haloterrigena salina]ELZ19458.1 hypothetical protein C477_08988 [Haloterrigena salina JCM 13891]